ncbi:MAG: aldose 1-epimerase [Gaiellaceae bacterium]
MPTPYSVKDSTRDGHATVVLASHGAELEAELVPGVGMVCCSLRHAGEELLAQRGGLAKYAETGSTMGIPLLYPWANRLGGFEYEAAGKEIDLDPESPLIRKDPNGLPIHGLLNAWPHWEVTDRTAAGDGARLTARLDFAAHEDLMAGFPFPHVLELEATLAGSALTITTRIKPAGGTKVPVAFGFHPYLRLPGVDRADWQVAIPARRQLELDDRQLPTGRSDPVRIEPGPLDGRSFDDAFGDLARPPRFVLWGGGRRLVVEFAKGYPFAQVYGPAGQELICFEPMTAPTNALATGDSRLRLAEPGLGFSASFVVAVEAAR